MDRSKSSFFKLSQRYDKNYDFIPASFILEQMNTRKVNGEAHRNKNEIEDNENLIKEFFIFLSLAFHSYSSSLQVFTMDLFHLIPFESVDCLWIYNYGEFTKILKHLELSKVICFYSNQRVLFGFCSRAQRCCCSCFFCAVLWHICGLDYRAAKGALAHMNHMICSISVT